MKPGPSGGITTEGNPSRVQAEAVHRVPDAPGEKSRERGITAVSNDASLIVHDLGGDTAIERRAAQPLHDRGAVGTQQSCALQRESVRLRAHASHRPAINGVVA